MSKFYSKIILLASIPIVSLAQSNNPYPKSAREIKEDSMGSILRTQGLGELISSDQKSRKTSKQAAHYKALWQAAIEYLSARDILFSDYEGGTIVTDWYMDRDCQTKIIVLIKGKTISPDSLRVKAWRKSAVTDKIQNLTKIDYELEKKAIEIIVEMAKKSL